MYEVGRPANGEEQFAGITKTDSEQIVSDAWSSEAIVYVHQQGSRTHG